MTLFEIIKFPYRVFRKAYLNNRKKKMGVWNFFLWQGKKAEEKIRREYYKQTFYTVKSEKTTVVYMANGFTWHGGLADRLKGIISLFCWCHDNSRSFKINFCHPFRLQDYLIPNQYDWLIGDDEISYNSQEARVLQCLLEPVPEFISHREEQSIFDIIVRRHGIKPYRDSSDHGVRNYFWNPLKDGERKSPYPMIII